MGVRLAHGAAGLRVIVQLYVQAAGLDFWEGVRRGGGAVALIIPFERLAKSPSLATLVVFALVNLALLRLRHRQVHTQGPHVRVPLWVPAAGFTACVAMIASALLR